MRFWLNLLLGLGVMQSLQAQEAFTGALKRIRDQGAVYIAYREDFPPLSYVDKQQGLWGYVPELCSRVVERLRAQLGRGDLKIVPVPAGGITRSMVVSNLDLDCSGVMNTQQKARQLAFSVHVYVSGIRALVRRDARIRSLEDMMGRQIVTTAGMQHEKYVKTRAAIKSINLRYVLASSNEEALKLVANGTADAFVSDDTTLMGLLVNLPDRESYGLLKEPFAGEPYGITIPSADPQLKQVVDSVLVDLMRSGELEALYNRWFMSPVPSLGIDYRVPMNELMKMNIRNPSDKGI